MRRDQDGMYFVDFLNAGIHGIRLPMHRLHSVHGITFPLDGGEGKVRERVGELRSWLTKELSVTAAGAGHNDAKIHAKVAWFRSYFNAVLRESAELQSQIVD